MQTDTILSGILGLLVADRDETDLRSTARILADAGLTDEHVARLTGNDPARLNEAPVAAFGHTSGPALSRPAAR